MKNYSICLLILSLFSITSCSKKQADDRLSGHILMGPFTTMIISGTTMSEKLNDLSDVPDEELQDEYKALFALPYSPAISQQAKNILSNEYQVSNNSAVEETITGLLDKSKSSEYKAYQYARAVNVANMAYSAGYFSKDEVSSCEQKVLIEAKANYKSWADYLEDFLSGRAKYLNKDPNGDQPLFEAVVNGILLDNDNSPYVTLEFPTL